MIQDAIRDVEDPFLMPITNESESNGSHERFPIPLVMVAGKANRIQMKLPISMMFFRQISQMIASFGIYTITSYLITRNLIVALIFRRFQNMELPAQQSSYKAWEHENRVPDVVINVLSVFDLER